MRLGRALRPDRSGHKLARRVLANWLVESHPGPPI